MITTRKTGWKFAEYELKGVPVRLAISAATLKMARLELLDRYIDQEIVPWKALRIHSNLLKEIQIIFSKKCWLSSHDERLIHTMSLR